MNRLAGEKSSYLKKAMDEPVDWYPWCDEAFEQAEPSTRTGHGGTGLGLTISRTLLQRMGYGLEVESTTGRGTRFGILLVDT